MEIIAKVDNEGEEAFNARLYVQVHSMAFRFYSDLLLSIQYAPQMAFGLQDTNFCYNWF